MSKLFLLVCFFYRTDNPFPTLPVITGRAIQRGCNVEALENPSGSSPFKDVLHSDCCDAHSSYARHGQC